MKILKRIKLAFRPKWAAAILLQKEEEEENTINNCVKINTINRLILWWGYPAKDMGVEETARLSLGTKEENKGFEIVSIIARRII